jgi:SAM-dependent methyltransferase
VCPERLCQREFPIIDGIPIIVPDPRSVISGQVEPLLRRDDLSPLLESLIGDCTGPGSELERSRYQVGSYARGHFGDLDPQQPAERESSVAGLVDRLWTDDAPAGAWLDIGCALGRGALEVAARTGEPVLGVDLNLAMLRTARPALTGGRLRYPHRKVGLVYDRRELEIELPGRDLVDLWACDATALPLADGTVAGALSLNILDCIASPLGHLLELGRVLTAGGRGLLCTPYDWSLGATAVEAWIGGHSQRSGAGGSSVAEMRRILGDGAPAGVDTRLLIDRELDDLSWRVYVHERAEMTYRTHGLILRGLGRAQEVP